MSVKPGNNSIFRLDQLDFDPRNPKPEDAWILKKRTSTGTSGASVGGLLLCITEAQDSATFSYYFSFQTIGGSTFRTLLEEDDPYLPSAILTETGDELITEDGSVIIEE